MIRGFFKASRSLSGVIAVMGMLAVLSLYLHLHKSNTVATPLENVVFKPASPHVNGLKVTDLNKGHGARAKSKQTLTFHYTAWIFNPVRPELKGEKFDSSLDRGVPMVVTLGESHVIAGLDQGLIGMRKNGKRLLVIPSDLGYGKKGAGNLVPPDADLVYEISLLKID